MNLYIQIEDGQPINHPAFEENLIQAFGSVPEHWEPFSRVQAPSIGVYEVLDPETPTYEKVDGVWTDVWHFRPMTDEEKAAKQQATKDAWAAFGNAQTMSTWTFDEEICGYVSPVPYPDDGKMYVWDDPTTSWIEVQPEYHNG